MKITTKTLARFSLQNRYCANNHWNIANGYPTVEQANFLRQVHEATYGIMTDMKITMKDVKNYKEGRGIQ